MTRPVPTPKPAAAPPVSSGQGLHLDLRPYLIRGENLDELQNLAQAYLHRYEPLDVVEEVLVRSMLLAQWNKQRWTRVENQLLDSPSGLLALLRDPATNALLKQVQCRIASENATHFRALAELRRLRKERSAAEPPAQQKETKPVTENWVRSVKIPATPAPQSGAAAAACQAGPIPVSNPSAGPVEPRLRAS